MRNARRSGNRSVAWAVATVSIAPVPAPISAEAARTSP